MASTMIRLLSLSLYSTTSSVSSATKSTCTTPTHNIHLTGISRRKSTLQKVTKSIKNINRGRMRSQMGPHTRAAPSRAGTRAKTRYIAMPEAMDTGSVQLRRNRNRDFISAIFRIHNHLSQTKVHFFALTDAATPLFLSFRRPSDAFFPVTEQKERLFLLVLPVF